MLRISLMSVDLPAPFGPIRPMMYPAGRSKVMSSSVKPEL